MQYSFFPPNFIVQLPLFSPVPFVNWRDPCSRRWQGTFQIPPDAENAPCAGYCAAFWFVLIIQQKADDEHNRWREEEKLRSFEFLSRPISHQVKVERPFKQEPSQGFQFPFCAAVDIQHLTTLNRLAAKCIRGIVYSIDRPSLVCLFVHIQSSSNFHTMGSIISHN